MNEPFEPLSLTRILAHSMQNEELNQAEMLLPKTGVERMERMVSALDISLSEVDISRRYFLAQQAALDKQQALGQHGITVPHRDMQAKLTATLATLTEALEWLQQTKRLVAWNGALGRALHDGQVDSVHVCRHWKTMDRDAMGARLLEYAAMVFALETLMYEIQAIIKSPEGDSLNELDDDDWEIVDSA
jgi:hypothetical protein